MAAFSLDSRIFSTAIIDRLQLDETPANRLKSLGLFEGQHVELSRAGNPLIVKAAGSRVAIAADLAKYIFLRDPEV